MTRKRFSAKAYTARLLEFNGCCGICGGKIGGAHGAIEWDHIIPLEMGGDDDLENLQPAHNACHKMKTAIDKGHIAKARRMDQREAGIRRQPKTVIPGSKGSKWKRKIGGGVVRRDEE